MPEPIAVIGYAYRAPAAGRKDLFEYLAAAKSAWSTAPISRFNHAAYYHPDPSKSGFISSQGAHFLPDDVYNFDAAFFNLKADEARVMDPQHRLILECAFEAVESAGINLMSLAGSRTGVFSSIDPSDYNMHKAEDLYTGNKFCAIGQSSCMFANRVSHFFDLRGPSIAVDGACASSTEALHLACQSLRAGECSAAIISGAKVIVSPSTWTGLDTMGATSAEGRCFSYDSRASGFGRGEGAASLVVKRLSDAVAAGDPIRGVIRSTACNHSGRSPGISAPSQLAQIELLQQLHANAGLDPSETTFVEGHGTGTPAGDPVEAGAFATVLGSHRSPDNPLYIGSVKSNFGHLEGASGVIGMVKGLLMLQHDVLLPNADFREMATNVEGREKLKVLQEVLPWPEDRKRRICLTNFGFGGSNAAVILESAQQVNQGNEELHRHVSRYDRTSPSLPAALNLGKTCTSRLPQRLYAFSAKSAASLSSYLDSFAAYLRHIPSSEGFSRALARTLGQRRTHFPHRAAVFADTPSLHAKIASLARSQRDAGNQGPVISFVFTGQGAQYAQMASELQRHQTFAAALLKAEQYLKNFGASWSLTEELNKPQPESRVDDVEISQPACTAVQLALVTLLRDWGVVPSYVVGHSSGEIAASFVAGIVPFETAMAIAYFRGLAAGEVLHDQSLTGAMLAVGASAEEAAALMPKDDGSTGYATIAAINSPSAVTIAGDEMAIDSIHLAAEAKGLFARKLNVGVAYHSRHMERVAASYRAAIKPFCDVNDFRRAESETVFLSSVTGQEESSATIDADYWVQNLLNPVHYSGVVTQLFASDTAPNIIVEIGPHPALKSPTKQILQSLQAASSVATAYLPSLSRDMGAEDAVYTLAASLYKKKVDLNFAKVNSDCADAAVLTSLPAYEWDKSRLIDLPRIVREKLHNGHPYDPMLGWKSPYAEGGEQTFRNVYSLDDMPWLRDHNIEGEILFPFTGFITQAIRAFRALHAHLTPGVAVRELYIKRALRIEEDDCVDITTKLRPAETGVAAVSSTTWKLEVLTWSDRRGWVSHCHGLIEAAAQDEYSGVPVTKTAFQALDDIKEGKAIQLDAETEYGIMRESGLLYGPAFSRMTSLWEFPNDSSVLVGEIQLGDFHDEQPGRPSPATVDAPTLDACLHLASRIQGRQIPRPMCIPSHINRLRISNSIPSTSGDKATFMAKLHHRDEKSGDMRISCVTFAHVGDERIPVAVTEDITFKCIARPQAEGVRDSAEHWTTERVPLSDVMADDKVVEDIVHAKNSTALNGQTIVVCGQFDADEELGFAKTVAGALEQHTGRICTVQNTEELDLGESPFCIFLDSRGQSILKDPTSGAFSMLKSLALDAAGILWISPENATPEAHFIEGFLRTLRLEDPMKYFLLLGNVSVDSAGIKGIKEIMGRLLSPDESFRWEQEFVLEDGKIKVPRLKKISAPLDPAVSRTEQRIWQEHAALELSADTIGDPSSIYFRRTNVLIEDLEDDSVIVRVEAVGVNFRDLLLVLGTMPWHPPGLEGVGVVHAAGANVSHLRPGDRVFYVTREGGYANFVRIPSSHVCQLPDSLGAVQAATMPIAFSTAIICLIRVARLAAGETVLIHAASGAVGQACIMIAQETGARIFATAGTQEKRDFLHHNFEIPKSQIFSSRTNEFRDGVLHSTDGKGVDVVVNSLSGQLLQDTWELIAEFGRFVEIGKKDLLQNSYLGMKPFARNVTYTGVDCREIFRGKPAMVRDLLQEVVNLWESKVIRPIQPITETPVSQITTALRRLQSGQNIGKIVVTMGPEERVLASGPPLDMKLSTDATYVITGGTGGIGRSLAVWLAGKGATNIVLLGRSGSSSSKVAALLQQYERSHVRLRAVACDVGSRKSVEDALQVLRAEKFPTIRGVIHGAFYLRDAMFLNSSYSDWEKITAPKIRGAWHMHALCPDLDFFVILASGAGLVGHFGQSIYAGTTTFLDAFAQHRNRLGLPAVSISLPAVEGIGIVAERNMVESLNVTLGMMLPEREVYEEVKAAIIGPASGRNADGKSVPIMPPATSGLSSEMEWQRHGMFTALREAHTPVTSKAGGTTTKVHDTSETLVEALRAKVSAMTMLHIDDTTADRNLQDYGLDSLVSGELRAWIRREVGVDMSLPRIVGAKNLRALADDALSQK